MAEWIRKSDVEAAIADNITPFGDGVHSGATGEWLSCHLIREAIRALPTITAPEGLAERIIAGGTWNDTLDETVAFIRGIG